MARTKRSPDANRVKRELDAELAAVSERTGVELTWSATERETLRLLMDSLDRRHEMLKAYAATDDTRERVRLSAEARLLEAAAARLLKTISTEPPAEKSAPAAPQSNTSAKASKAATMRWNRERMAGNAR